VWAKIEATASTAMLATGGLSPAKAEGWPIQKPPRAAAAAAAPSARPRPEPRRTKAGASAASRASPRGKEATLTANEAPAAKPAATAASGEPERASQKQAASDAMTHIAWWASTVAKCDCCRSRGTQAARSRKREAVRRPQALRATSQPRASATRLATKDRLLPPRSSPEYSLGRPRRKVAARTAWKWREP